MELSSKNSCDFQKKINLYLILFSNCDRFMSKRLGLGRIWDKLVDQYPWLWKVEQAIGYTIWTFILLAIGVSVWHAFT
ncbi:hypothetical protein BXP70_28610 [Hymenobacter crusticola]|uniref:Uncharacterized protein n=1 Tax=Hymenobacter crusticola TaxID=1770526 RepID=A0A243W4Y6_9BACT|nr:hypothetical protein BXP70_28610 [Hymenobacter crusticola]